MRERGLLMCLLPLVPAVAAAGRCPLAELHGEKTF